METVICQACLTLIRGRKEDTLAQECDLMALTENCEYSECHWRHLCDAALNEPVSTQVWFCVHQGTSFGQQPSEIKWLLIFTINCKERIDCGRNVEVRDVKPGGGCSLVS